MNESTKLYQLVVKNSFLNDEFWYVHSTGYSISSIWFDNRIQILSFLHKFYVEDSINIIHLAGAREDDDDDELEKEEVLS